MQITIKDIEPIPPDSFESHHYIKGIAKVKGKLIVLLDIIALFEFEQDSDNSNNQKEIEELKTFRNNSEIENKNIQAKDLESTTENDIPDVLKEVFKEDEEKNSLKESTS
jgi:hypothetical protein